MTMRMSAALGDDEDVGRLQAGGEVAEAAPGHELVFLDGPVVIDQDDVHVGLEPAVLEGVVQDDQVGLRDGLVQAVLRFLGGLELLGMGQEPATFHAVLVHGDGYGGELLRYLQRLVAVQERRSVAAHLLEAFRLPLVAAGKDGDVGIGPVIAAEEHPEDHLRMRCLSGAAHGDVAHANGGNIRLV